MAKKKNKGRRIYYIFLTIYGLLLTGAAVFGLSLVWSYAEEYEASRPYNAIDEYVAELNETKWIDGIEDAIRDMPHEAQTNAECAEIVKEMLGSGVTYSRMANLGDSKVANYALKCNGSTFGTVSFIEDESYSEKSRFGLLPWVVYEESFDFTGLYNPVEITVPATYTVELNGFELEEQYIIEDGIKLDALENYYETCPGLVTKVTYRFENAIGPLSFTVYDEDGNEFVLDENADDSQFINYCDEAMLNRMSDFAYEFSDRYFNYITGMVDPMYGYQRLGTVMKSGSDLDGRMKIAMDGLSWAHTSSLRIDSVVLNGGINLGDGFYVADVTTQTTTLQPGQGEVVGTHNMKIVLEDAANELRALTLELY